MRRAATLSLADHAPFFVIEFDDGVSVIPAKNILDPPCASVRVGNSCLVKWGRQRFHGIVHDMGKSNFSILFCNRLCLLLACR